MDIIGTAQKLIRRGYGFNQLITELNLTKETFYEVCLKNLAFKNEVERRYDIKIDSKVEEDRTDGVSERSEKARGENKGNSKRSNKRNKRDDTSSID